MKAVFCVLTQSDHIAAIMERFLEAGVKGATVLKSTGMSHYLESPYFFSRIRQLTGSEIVNNQTIFLVVEDHLVSRVLDIVDEVTGGLDKDGAGIAFVLPVEETRGL